MVGLAYPEISPIIFSIGPVAIRWYSMAYLVGIILGWWLASSRVKKYDLGLSKTNCEDVAFAVTLGIILGGRIGYILFYGAGQYLQKPLEIFALWHGGMSFHGGIFGVIIALFVSSRLIKYPFLKLTDLVAPVVPIGIFLGRIANFINDELWGRVTDVAWAVRFPRGGFLPRHPSQIYEACLEGIALFVILNLLWKNKWCREHDGVISGAFLLGYSCFRAISEQFREPDVQIGFLWGGFTMGQWLSLPITLIGFFLLLRSFFQRKKIKVSRQ
ncbi:MAG: prolipoprotein diacylglyceryl transferase [Alphaproteobacteria bacterium]|nr:prolipoprotein diacylglyceryl transferase [Alphaproteobacteria bacterium]